MSRSDNLRRASDPATPLSELHELAQNVPETRPSIAANPSTYPELLDWLAEFDDPDIHAALQARDSTREPQSPQPWGDETPWEGIWDDDSTNPSDLPWIPTPTDDPHDTPHAHTSSASPRPRRRRTLLILTTSLALALLATAGLGLWYGHDHPNSAIGSFITGKFASDDTTTARPSVAAPADTDNPAAAEHSGTERAQESLALPQQERVIKEFPKEDESAGVRPVPPAAYTDVTRFQVDNGQIACEINANQATCIIKHTNEDYGNHGGPLHLAISSGGAFVLSEPTRDPASVGNGYPVLSDTAAVAQGTLACQSSGGSVECWDATTGHGFTAGGGRVGQF